MVKPCWSPCSYGSNENGALGRTDPLLWHKDFGYHAYGEYSMAVVQANTVLEDQSQLESGPLSFSRSGPTGTFIGIYDGHGGPEASQFVNENLFNNFKRFAAENNGISKTVIEEAFQETEKEFLSLVKKEWLKRPQIAATGSCCLVGIICGGMLYVANAGDSRVILGRTRRSSKDVVGLQLSTEHNASLETVRRELRSSHPYDSDIVVLKQKVWRVKGIIQVSRSIGDAYLKRAEFNKAPLPSKYRLSQPILKPILSAEPTISIQRIQPEDQFLVFASDGLWEYLSNQEVTNMVQAYPRKGIAKRLVETAMKEASNRREMRYTDLKKVESGVRRYFHDDITVAVVFLNMKLVDDDSHSTLHSIQGGNLLLPH